MNSTVPRKDKNIFVPDFSSQSYLELPTLNNVATAFVIEIWFLTRSPNGLIFYNGQESNLKKGDFVSLNLVDGHLEYKFNLGSVIPHIR